MKILGNQFGGNLVPISIAFGSIITSGCEPIEHQTEIWNFHPYFTRIEFRCRHKSLHSYPSRRDWTRIGALKSCSNRLKLNYRDIWIIVRRHLQSQRSSSSYNDRNRPSLPVAESQEGAEEIELSWIRRPREGPGHGRLDGQTRRPFREGAHRIGSGSARNRTRPIWRQRCRTKRQNRRKTRRRRMRIQTSRRQTAMAIRWRTAGQRWLFDGGRQCLVFFHSFLSFVHSFFPCLRIDIKRSIIPIFSQF